METSNIVPYEILERVTDVFKVLAHPQRLCLCEALLAEKLSVNQLCQKLGLKQNVVSQHLGKLRSQGVVTPLRKGRTVFYQVIHPAPGWLLDCIKHHFDTIADK